jgi:hypothetical protein
MGGDDVKASLAVLPFARVRYALALLGVNMGLPPWRDMKIASLRIEVPDVWVEVMVTDESGLPLIDEQRREVVTRWIRVAVIDRGQS